MKKAIVSILAVSAAATALVGCGAPKPQAASVQKPQEPAHTEQRTRSDDNVGVRGGRLGDLSPIFGVRRRLSIAGEYTVEYVHKQRDAATDDTLDYSLSLRDDHTYEMRVVAKGVKSDHYGNWYVHDGGGLTLFFDEPIESPAHNEYVTDCMYAELLPQGKIMIYDGGNTIVLSRNGSAAAKIAEFSLFSFSN